MLADAATDYEMAVMTMDAGTKEPRYTSKTPYQRQRQRRRQKQHIGGACTVILALLLTFAIFLIVALITAPSQPLWRILLPNFRPPSSRTQAAPSESAETLPGALEPGGGLAITLHPELHVSREPKTLYLHWNVSAGVLEPDGVKKRVFLVNGQFPGPTVEARSGDELVVEVHNSLPVEGVSIHWHGLRMMNQNAFDGAGGITQCPIPPGSSFTYRVRIGDDEYGTFWWHTHAQVQRGDGLFGGLVVHRPTTAAPEPAFQGPDSAIYGYDQEKLLMIGDWFHDSAQDTLNWFTDYKHWGSEPVPDTLLINGRGRFDCASAVPARPVECTFVAESELNVLGSGAAAGVGSKQRWRIINTGSMAGFSLALGGARMTPIAVDGGAAVNSSSTDAVGVLYVGERVDLLVEWAQGSEPEDGRLYIALDPENFKYTNPSLQQNQTFPLLAGTSGEAAGAEETPSFPNLLGRLNLASLTAAYPDLPASQTTTADEARHSIVLYSKTLILARFENSPKGYINHTFWVPQAQALLGLPRASWDENQFVPFIPSSGDEASTWVDLVINNLDDGAHPFHLHGHSFYVLSTYRATGRLGWGSYNPFDAERYPQPPAGPLNLEAPLRKDTVSVPRHGHVVLRFRADNPGLWMLHCHMLPHLGAGMAMALHVGPPGDEAHINSAQTSALDMCLL